MKLSGINLIERHVEKVLILIGVLFAIWLIYQNFVKQPNTVPLSPNQPFVTVQPGEVGQNITKAVADLSEKIKEAQDHPPTFPPVPDYLADLAAQEQNPLAQILYRCQALFLGLPTRHCKTCRHRRNMRQHMWSLLFRRWLRSMLLRAAVWRS